MNVPPRDGCAQREAGELTFVLEKSRVAGESVLGGGETRERVGKGHAFASKSSSSESNSLRRVASSLDAR